MKAIFAIALLVFAAQASLLDSTDYTLGFDSQLGLDSSEVNTGLECFQSLNTTIATVISLVQDFRQNPDSAIFTGINLVAIINGDLKTNCEQYFQDVVSLIMQQANITDIEPEEIEEIVEQNFQFYLPQILQQSAVFFDALIAQAAYEAGATEAYIIQILLGLQKPARVQEPAFNFTQYVPLDTQKYISEFTQAYFTKINGNPEASTAFVQCYTTLSENESAIESFIQNFRAASGVVEKVLAVQNSSDALLEVIEICLPALEYNIEVYAPIWDEIKESPIQTILTIAHNVALNAPQIDQLMTNQDVEVFTGEYTEAGDDYASAFVTVFAGAGY